MRASVSPARRQDVDTFLQDFTVLPFDGMVAREFGELRSHQWDTGTLTPALDLQIAATAIAHNLVLVTHNTADFAGIPGLQLDDWLTP